MTTRTDAIPSPPSQPTLGPIETLLTAYRRMMPGPDATPRLEVVPVFRMGTRADRSEDAWAVRLSVRVGDVALCEADGLTVEEAARLAFEKLRKEGAPV